MEISVNYKNRIYMFQCLVWKRSGKKKKKKTAKEKQQKDIKISKKQIDSTDDL